MAHIGNQFALSEPNELLKTALSYAGIGWRVIPLNGKKPLPNDWPNKASTDVRRITTWFSRSHNIGVVTGEGSGIVVVDIDPRNGGNETLDRLIEELGQLPDTVTALTGGGGKHLIFKFFEGAKSTKVGGIDFLANGKQFVAAPSIHPVTNELYSWVRSPFDATPADLPVKWQHYFSAPKSKPKIELVADNTSKDIPEGNRNDALTSLAGRLKSTGMNKQSIEIKLLEENLLYCKPPLPEVEVIAIADSIAKYDNKGQSFKTQWQEAVWDSDEPMVTKAVLQALARFADKDGRSCFPTQETIAKCASCALKTAVTHLKAAKTSGWIETYRMPRSQSGYHYGYMLKIKDR